MSTERSNIWEFETWEEAQEACFQKGWTDGLPVIPPTREKVEEFLRAAGVKADTLFGSIPERNRVFTAEKIAVNAVMAGCLPEYFPVVLTAVQAMCDPQFGLHGPTASTAGAAILVIVNGPYARQLGMNSGENYFGPGNRANATIGRALRLLLLNAGGREYDRTTLGHPGKYTYCVAEDETTAWDPLHVQRGFDRLDSTVTVLAAESPNQVQNHNATKPENILLSIADRMRAMGSFNMSRPQECAVVICKEHYYSLSKAGWDKSMVQSFLFEHARRPLADLKRCGILEGDILPQDENIMITAVPSPDDIILLVGGGEAGRFSAFIPGWNVITSSRSVTKRINPAVCEDC